LQPRKPDRNIGSATAHINQRFFNFNFTALSQSQNFIFKLPKRNTLLRPNKNNMVGSFIL